jgi:Ca2+-binding RTX toxin-like protein
MPFSKAEYARLKSGGKKLSALIGTPGYTGRNNLTLAMGSQIDRAVGGSGKDTFIANARMDTLDGGQGDDRFFLTGGNAALTGGEGDDTVFLKKKAGAVWRLGEDHDSLTLTSTSKATKETTTLATVSLSDIEHVRYWDGSALKATSKALFAAPSGSAKLTVAYAPPAAASTTWPEAALSGRMR